MSICAYLFKDVVLLHLYSTTAFVSFYIKPEEQGQSVEKDLGSIKSWLDILLSLHPAAYAGLPFSVFSQLIRCLNHLSSLLSLDAESEDWKTADSFTILDRLIDNFGQVAALADLDNSDTHGDDIFSRFANMLRSVRADWEAKLRPEHLAQERFLQDSFDMDFDNNWLMDLFLPPNC